MDAQRFDVHFWVNADDKVGHLSNSVATLERGIRLAKVQESLGAAKTAVFDTETARWTKVSGWPEGNVAFPF